MRRTIPDLDEQIIKCAETLFLEKGMLAVEMKDIADTLGISRSTLYRHFTNKLDIAFDIIRRYIVELYSISLPLTEDSSGYQYVAAYLPALLNRLFDSLDRVRLILEFDILYNSRTPVTPRMERYEAFFRDYRAPLFAYVTRGIEDGSIRGDIPAQKLVYILNNTCISLTQRIGLRQAVYEREHGFSLDVITDAVRVLLDGLKPENVPKIPQK